MIHYFVQRGHSVRELASLSTTERLFLISSMILQREEENSAYGNNEQPKQSERITKMSDLRALEKGFSSYDA